ncbi:Dehydrogenase/reductase SDR member 12 [Entophlyctis luteolus]|nr:Dehydrogenase/reductase SDR member 12 [Entophlyctis luteolus]
MAEFLEAAAVAYRATVFGVSGFFSFTRLGFEKAALAFTPNALDNPDNVNKTILITGANSGLGRAAAEELAVRGASVHLLCRDPVRGRTARDEIAKAANNSKVTLHVVDVSSVKAIKEFANEWSKVILPLLLFLTYRQHNENKIDVLINNAGILPATRTETPEGLESTFATNTIGTYALTTLLLPYLRKSSDPRVVTVSSGGAFNKKLDVSDVNFTARPVKSFDGTLAYAQTKRQQIELTEYWAKKNPTIRFYSMHPGWADTPGVQSSIPGFYNAMKSRLRTAAQGADTIVWAAVALEAKRVRNGAFLFDRKETTPHVALGGTHADVGAVDTLVQICEGYLARL